VAVASMSLTCQPFHCWHKSPTFGLLFRHSQRKKNLFRLFKIVFDTFDFYFQVQKPEVSKCIWRSGSATTRWQSKRCSSDHL